MKNKNEFLIISGNAISHFGDVIFTFGLNWWIVSITGNAKLLGIITTVSLIPSIFTNLFGGVISDRFNKKKILIYTDIVSSIACFLLAFYSSQSYINIPLIIIVNVILGICFSLFSPAARSIVPEIINKERVRNVNSLLSSINETIKIGSPLIGGFILSLSFIDIKTFFIINGISFLISGISEIFITYPQKTKKTQASFIKDFMDGFKYVRRNSILFRLLIVISLVNFFLAGYNVLLPALVHEEFSKSYIYSFLLSSEAIGGILGALLLSRKKDSIPELKAIRKELLYCGSVFLILFISLKLFTLIPVLFLFGFFLTRFNILFFTYIQTNIDESVLGRVFSFIFTTAVLLMPLGSFLFGYLINIPLTYIFPLVGVGISLSIILINESFPKVLYKENETDI